MKKKTVIILFITLLGIGLFFWQIVASQAKKEKSQIKTTKVKRTDLIKSISASGKIGSGKEVELKFQTSGQLVWVGVKLGDIVKPWQAIAQLDKRELELNLQKYLKDYMKERWDFEEDRQVTYRDKVLTDSIKRILEKNQFDLDKAVIDVELRDLALKFATLVTPIGGIVTSIDTPVPGVNITPATAVFKISDPNELVFKADVDETDIGRVKEGQKVRITFDAYPEEIYESVISRIDFVAKTTTGGGTAFSVEVKLPENPNLKYKLGMNGDIEIIESEKKNVLVIPLEALHHQEGKRYVYILEGKKAVKKWVTTGVETEEEAEIKEGLNEGEKVIISGMELGKK